MTSDKPRDGWRRLLGLDVESPILKPQRKAARISGGGGYAESALQNEYDRILRAQPGTINDATNRAAFSVGTLVGGNELEYDYAWGRLVIDLAAEKWGEDPDENHVRTVESGLKSGMLHPRTAPKKEQSEENAADPEDALMAALARLEGMLMSSADLDNMPDPEPLIDGLLYRNTLAWCIAEPGTGKSLAVLDMAGHIGAGRSWSGMDVQPGTVLYIVAEDEFGIKPRVRAWESWNQSGMQGVLFLPVPVQAGSLDWEALTLLVRARRPDLTVLDTQSMMTIGREENSAAEMSVFVKCMDDLRVASGGCILSVHHANKGGGMRGSTTLPGAANTIMRMKRDDEDLVTLTTQLSQGGKQRNAAPTDLAFRIEPHAGSIVLERVALL